MKSIFLHIGAHKTGTTTIQQVLLNNPSLTSVLGKQSLVLSIHNPVHGYKAMRVKYTHLRNSILFNHHIGKPVPEKTIRDMASLLRDFADTLPCDHLVWSDENLLGNTPGHPNGQIKDFTSGLYPASAEIAEAFALAFKDYEVHVRLYTREIEGIVRSSYSDWMMKLRDSTDFATFEAALRRDVLDWNIVATSWRELFGDRFEMCAFETIRSGQGPFLSEFARWAKLRVLDEKQLNEAPPANQSFNARQIEIAKCIAPLITPEERPMVRRLIGKLGSGS